ncbi:MAG: hypothetical protein DU429_02950 [Candidatus Tokpelaia sp.]|nr:MAG: hypothetical protein DU430_05705 [Candidatus Tokpelaia sp.]KAA6207425.1 MAG: hypothetical protein DU429_02950 [Candidatus Tokpelaia sp.]
MKQNSPKLFTPGHGYTKEDWDAVDSSPITDKEFALMRPAGAVLPPDFFEALQQGREEKMRGRPKIENPKEVLTIRLAPAAIAYFKSRGRNWRQKLRKDLEKLAGI